MAIETVKATINDIEYSLTYNPSTEKWEGVMTAPTGSSFNLPGGYFDVEVKAMDDASNSSTVDSSHPTLGEDCRLYVAERQKPEISIITPGSNSHITTNTPVIEFQLRDNKIGGIWDSGIDITTLEMRIDGGAVIGHDSTGMSNTPVSGGYNFEYVPQTALSDGVHTITIDVEDNDNNSADTSSRTFTVDTVAPSLNVTSPEDGLIANSEEILITGTTNDSISSIVVVEILVNGVDQGTIEVDEYGDFSHEATLIEGSNTISITATDLAGKQTTVTRTVILKTSAPVFTSVVIEPNSLDAGATYTITVSVIEVD